MIFLKTVSLLLIIVIISASYTFSRGRETWGPIPALAYKAEPRENQNISKNHSFMFLHSGTIVILAKALCKQNELLHVICDNNTWHMVNSE